MSCRAVRLRTHDQDRKCNNRIRLMHNIDCQWDGYSPKAIPTFVNIISFKYIFNISCSTLYTVAYSVYARLPPVYLHKERP
jgi:hypothetical protein